MSLSVFHVQLLWGNNSQTQCGQTVSSYHGGLALNFITGPSGLKVHEIFPKTNQSYLPSFPPVKIWLQTVSG